MHRNLPALLLLSLALAGCGARVSAPSLLPRPVERQPIEAPEPAREAESPVDPALSTRIAALLAEAGKRHAAFEEQRERTGRLVAAAGRSATGSEPWIAAQQAISALDAARGPLQELVGQVDDLRLDTANAALGNRTAIDAAAAELDRMVQAEASAIGELTGRLA